MWDLPRPGLEPVSAALAGGFLTTVPPGKSLYQHFKDILLLYFVLYYYCGRKLLPVSFLCMFFSPLMLLRSLFCAPEFHDKVSGRAFLFIYSSMLHAVPNIPMDSGLPVVLENSQALFFNSLSSSLFSPSETLTGYELHLLIISSLFFNSSSKFMLNKSGESGHPCLVPDLSGNAFSFSPLRMMFEIGRAHV